jgi:hypothetical protein
MALPLLLAGAAQGHALEKGHIVADLAGLADDHAHTMVDEEVLADGGAGWISMPVKSASPGR